MIILNYTGSSAFFLSSVVSSSADFLAVLPLVAFGFVSFLVSGDSVSFRGLVPFDVVSTKSSSPNKISELTSIF